jgi:nitrate/nitrite transporter NarK
MISDSMKTIAVIIVVAMVLAATTPLFVGAKADGMSLRARDIGPGWQELDRRQDSGLHAFSNSTSVERVIMVKNSTFYVIAYLYTFDSPEHCHIALNATKQSVYDAFSPEDVGIGDGGYFMKFPSGGLIGSNIYFGMILEGGFNLTNIKSYAGLRYTQGSILVIIDVVCLDVNHPSQDWINYFTIGVGYAQLIKISMPGPW